MAIDSKIMGQAKDVAIPCSIFVEWTVTLSVPSLEADDDKAPSSPVVTTAAFYVRQGHEGLWWSDTQGVGDNPQQKIPGIQWNIVYQVSPGFYVDYGAKSSLSGNYNKVRMVQDRTYGVTLFVLDHAGKHIEALVEKNQWVLDEGAVLTPVIPNVTAGMEYLSLKPSPRPSGESSTLFCPENLGRKEQQPSDCWPSLQESSRASSSVSNPSSQPQFVMVPTSSLGR